jgi:hypothetical protein
MSGKEPPYEREGSAAGYSGVHQGSAGHRGEAPPKAELAGLISMLILIRKLCAQSPAQARHASEEPSASELRPEPCPHV